MIPNYTVLTGAEAGKVDFFLVRIYLHYIKTFLGAVAQSSFRNNSSCRLVLREVFALTAIYGDNGELPVL